MSKDHNIESRPYSLGIDVITPKVYRRPPSNYPFVKMNKRPLPSKFTKWILDDSKESGVIL